MRERNSPEKAIIDLIRARMLVDVVRPIGIAQSGLLFSSIISRTVADILGTPTDRFDQAIGILLLGNVLTISTSLLLNSKVIKNRRFMGVFEEAVIQGALDEKFPELGPLDRLAVENLRNELTHRLGK